MTCTYCGEKGDTHESCRFLKTTKTMTIITSVGFTVLGILILFIAHS